MDWQICDGLVDWSRIDIRLALNSCIGDGLGFNPSLVWEWKIGDGLAELV